jgi:uncharacterized protein YbjT (DUF2867 family)
MKYSRLLVLGGTGRAGRQLILEALERGYQVTALARDPAQLSDIQTQQLQVLRGDMTNAAQVEELLKQGFDAVVCTLGVFQKSPGTPLTDMTRHLVSAMKKYGPARLVVMSSLGVGDSDGQGNLLVKFVTSRILKHVLVDKASQEVVLQESGLDWTVLRPPRLIDSPTRKPYRLWQGTARPRGTRWRIGTLDAASEMLNLLEQDDSFHSAWQCSY